MCTRILNLIAVIALVLPSLISTQQSCSTPIRSAGMCVPFGECEYISRQYAKYGSNMPGSLKRFIQLSICEGDDYGIHICCDIKSLKEKTTTTTTKATTTRASLSRIAKDTSNTDQFKKINQRGLEVLDRVTKCGSRATPKVSGGENAKLGEFPWMALLRYNNEHTPFQCGGSVITERYILTAAHCLVSVDDDLIGVVLGEHNLKTNPDCQYRGKRRDCFPEVDEYGIESVKVHPRYEDGKIFSDIALIKVDRNIEFKRNVKPVCLPITSKSKQIVHDQLYLIAGWGLTDKTRQNSDILQKATVTRQSLDVCRKVFVGAPITDNHICAAGNGIVDTCRGDSGGPLFFLAGYKETNRFIQYGVVSFGGAKCGDTRGLPGVYANVIDMLPWITHNID